MKTIKKFLLASILAIFWFANLAMITTPVDAANLGIYNDVIWRSGRTTQWWSLKSAIAWTEDVGSGTGSDLVNDQILKLVGYIIDIFIVVWIAVAFIGWFKIMTSDDEKTMKEWIRLVVFGIIWIIIMVSARFLAIGLTDLLDTEFVDAWIDTPRWMRFASDLYKKLVYPFIKVALYFVIGILFFMMAWKVVGFMVSTDDTAKKKAGGVIIRSIVWILIIMWAKQLVEAVMWQQSTVTRTDVDRIDGQSPESILEFGSMPIVYQILNWVMWLTMFAILVLVVLQWYKMFTKPDDPKTRESLKKTLIYIIIWVLVIWWAYAISSVLVMNNIPIETGS